MSTDNDNDHDHDHDDHDDDHDYGPHGNASGCLVILLLMGALSIPLVAEARLLFPCRSSHRALKPWERAEMEAKQRQSNAEYYQRQATYQASTVYFADLPTYAFFSIGNGYSGIGIFGPQYQTLDDKRYRKILNDKYQVLTPSGNIIGTYSIYPGTRVYPR